jgi:outer membrane protein TolC
MMFVWAILLAFSMAFGPIGPASAEEDLFAGVTVLEPEHLVALVQARNADLEAARATAEVAATRIGSAGALDDPRLSYKLAPATIGSGEFGTRQGVEVFQAFPWPGTLSARQAKAREESDAVQSGATLRELEIAADTKAAFAEWLFVHAALGLNRQHQSHLRTAKVALERSYAAGVAREQDAIQADIELVRMENDALALESRRSALQARINALLNRAPEANLPEPARLAPFGPVPSLDQLKAAAIARHPELKELEAVLGATDAGITLARKAFYPDLMLQAAYDEMWDEKEKRPSVGVSINVPLQWGRRQAELAGARAEKRKTEWRLIDRKAALLASIAEALAGVDQADRSIDLHRNRLLPLADAALSATLADYRRGTGTFSSVIAAERGKLDQELSLERALADRYRNFAALERAAGGSLTDLEDVMHPPASSRDGGSQERRP